MTHPSHWLDTLSRREAFGHVARATLGVGLLPAVSRQLEAAANGTKSHAEDLHRRDRATALYCGGLDP
jgi:hypothetical protein